MRLSTVAVLLLSAALIAGAAPAAEQGQRQKPERARKHEPLTAEQKKQLAEDIKAGIERRKAERSQLQSKLKAADEQFLALQRQRIASENAALRLRLNAFKSEAGDPRYDAIEREARELSRRAEKATDAERRVIDQRAAELLAELRGRKPRR